MSTLKKDIAIVLIAIGGAVAAMKCNHHVHANACTDKHGDTIVGCASE